MNQDERQKFWDVLLSMHDTESEHIQALHQMISVPHTLCRFRSVNESSLTQLLVQITTMIRSIHIFISTTI